MSDNAEKTPPPAVPAATIMILRDEPETGELEVFMVVRHHQIDFASGALVFPGGKAAPSDSAPGVRAYCDGEVGLDDVQLNLHVAAIREAFEESGVLLARRGGSPDVVGPDVVASLDHLRPLLDKGDLAIEDFMKENDLRLACDLLVPFAHWVTPNMMPKRFDTYFFLAAAPDGQAALHDGSETVDSVWANPSRLLKEADEGKWTVIFPTRMNVEKVGKASTVQEAMANARADKIVTVLPEVIQIDGEPFLKIPAEAGYSVTTEPLSNVPDNVKGTKKP
jgi:8-oxo-dGTP pyrophosphatase MutT (NUDIX family)